MAKKVDETVNAPVTTDNATTETTANTNDVFNEKKQQTLDRCKQAGIGHDDLMNIMNCNDEDQLNKLMNDNFNLRPFKL
jgi:hypothetical protein